jgi:hypothetical protein
LPTHLLPLRRLLCACSLEQLAATDANAMNKMCAKCGITHSPLDLTQLADACGRMSGPVRLGCGAENGDGTERAKDRAENSVIRTPGTAVTARRERQGRVFSWCPFPSRLERGTRPHQTRAEGQPGRRSTPNLRNADKRIADLAPQAIQAALAFIQLASIRLWLRVNESAP